MNNDKFNDLKNQCDKMLNISPSSFVLNYTKSEFRFASANKISGTSNKNLHKECDWTSYRFFLEFFRCPIGDRNITSALAKNLNIPNQLLIIGESAQL